MRIIPENISSRLKTLFSSNRGIATKEEIKQVSSGVPTSPQIQGQPIQKTNLPNGRQSYPSVLPGTLSLIGTMGKFVYPQWLRETIPVIRQLMMTNPDVSQAMYNMVTLGNTGHKIIFDRGVPEAQVEKMRNHLVNKHSMWSTGQAGMDGLINKMFYQILCGGALSGEWVPNASLTGVESHVFVNPEEIYFKLDKRRTGYQPFQKVVNGVVNFDKNFPGLIPLNPNTYKYWALNGDTDLPYGFPPYLSVIPRIETQEKMHQNIDFIVDQFGVIGFLEALLQKPDQLDEETDEAFKARLDLLLGEAKSNLVGGIKDGVVTGFTDDHKFEFHSLSKDYKSVGELFKGNELQISSALKQDAALWGRDYGTSETQITVVFTKLLSEFRNIQNIIKAHIEFGYTLELTLAGFKFDYLQVKFNHSTIQDDLKFQQAEEIKIRNVKDKYILGVINQDQMADELNYEKSDQKAPRVPVDVLAGGSLPTDKAGDKVDKQKRDNESAKKTRKTNKVLPKDK